MQSAQCINPVAVFSLTAEVIPYQLATGALIRHVAPTVAFYCNALAASVRLTAGDRSTALAQSLELPGVHFASCAVPGQIAHVGCFCGGYLSFCWRGRHGALQCSWGIIPPGAGQEGACRRQGIYQTVRVELVF